jgi:hypothetical protein
MMANITAQGGHKKQGLVSRKTLLIIAIVTILVIALLVVYLEIVINNAIRTINNAYSGPIPKSSMSASLIDQELLGYNNLRQYIPYGLISYTSRNVTNINANISLLKYAPPSQIYILNISNECYECGNTQAIEAALYSKLMYYKIISSPSQVLLISPSQLRTLPPDSLLIVINGLLPSEFLQQGSGGITDINYLLNEHTSILYAGQNFSRVLLPDSVTTPSTNLPSYLYTLPFTVIPKTQKVKNGFYFNSSKFTLYNGTNYSDYLSYEAVYNGSIAVFPNTPASWKSANQTGSDLAKAVQSMFWLPKYAHGTRTVNISTTNATSGQFGVLLNSQNVPYNVNFSTFADNGTMRVILTANASYFYGTSNNVYQYINAKPQFFYNGTLSAPNTIITNQTVPLTFTIVTHSQVPINIQPHITIYTLNMTQVYSTPLGFLHNVSNNITFYGPPNLNLLLQPGKGYIIKLHSFEGSEYSAGFINVSPLSLFIVRENITTDQFLFSVTSNRQPLTNIPYSLELNNLYPSNGVIKNGTLYYSVPSGTPTINGNLNFTFTVLGGKFHYYTSFNPLPFAISDQYIEVAVVVVLMLIMIVFVRAPHLDEFYIDVPNLPEEKKTPIKLKSNEVVGVFDKLNTSYHWKYMPLSKQEIRSAISTNIKYNNIPVGLTYSNVERMLDQLTVNKYLVMADNLYAPAQWLNQSKHDIEYLATFKKLRIYLVTHAYIFTDLDMSTNSDIVATLHGERKYIVIYSKTSKFEKVPIYTGSKTYIVFLNGYKLDEFRNSLYESATQEAEELKMYIAADIIKLIDADNPSGLLA